VGPRAVLDAVVKRKLPSPCRESNTPIRQPVAHRYTYTVKVVTLFPKAFCFCSKGTFWKPDWGELYFVNFLKILFKVFGAGMAQWYSSGLRAG
jgi:hypothetical protein